MEGLNTLTGACLPLFIKMYRIARLTQQRRETSAWGDEALVDIVAAAEELELELQAEKIRMASLVQGRAEIYFTILLLISSQAITCLASVSTRGLSHRLPHFTSQLCPSDTRYSITSQAFGAAVPFTPRANVPSGITRILLSPLGHLCDGYMLYQREDG
jgi:hypothetical protein